MHPPRPSRRTTTGRPALPGKTLLVPVALWTFLVITVLALPGQILAQAPSQEPPRLQDQVTDLTQQQVLAGDQAQIDAALADLRASRNVQLFVLFVESTGSRTVTEYADEVARRSSLGGNDALLLVALADRSDALWRGSLLRDRLTDQELETILSERVEPLLARGDFAGAVVASASGIAEAVVSSGGAASQPGGLGSTIPILVLVGLAVLTIGGLWLWNTVSSRRRQRQAAEAYARQTEQLEAQASAGCSKPSSRPPKPAIPARPTSFAAEDGAPAQSLALGWRRPGGTLNGHALWQCQTPRRRWPKRARPPGLRQLRRLGSRRRLPRPLPDPDGRRLEWWIRRRLGRGRLRRWRRGWWRLRRRPLVAAPSPCPADHVRPGDGPIANRGRPCRILVRVWPIVPSRPPVR